MLLIEGIETETEAVVSYKSPLQVSIHRVSAVVPGALMLVAKQPVSKFARRNPYYTNTRQLYDTSRLGKRPHLVAKLVLF